MNYVGILAGGQGTRMNYSNTPKQFLMLGKVPIIIHTIEQFYIAKKIEKIIIAVPNDWISYTKDILKKYIPNYNDKIVLVSGGSNRNESIINICNFIDTTYQINDDDVLITHDAVRPFITQRIINDNIEAVKKNGITDTVIEAIDTIVESTNGEYITHIPNRSHMYQGQTPQAFNIKQFIKLYENLSEENKAILTDAAKIFVLGGMQPYIVKGEQSNIKITTLFDLRLARMLLNMKDDEVKGID